MKYTEISHFSHPHHTLKLEYSEAPFKCDGCKEAGIGSRYRCTGGAGSGWNGGGYHSSACNFDLHTHCAVPLPSIKHPFYTKCSFQFMSRPPGEKARYCNACEKDVNGFVYHCKACGFDLHPCCAKLPMHLDDGETKLYLHKKVKAPCLRCGRKVRSWIYRSSCKKYNLHVACAKEMLAESWHEIRRGSSCVCDGTGVGGGGDGVREVNANIPSLKGSFQAAQRRKKSKGTSTTLKGCEIAGMGVQAIVSAVMGDPTALIVGLIGALI